MKMLERFRAARRSAVPLLSITTPDPQATMAAIVTEAVLKSTAKWSSASGDIEIELKNAPLVQWDIVRGCLAKNSAAAKMLAGLVGAEAVENGGGFALDVQTAERIKSETAMNPVNALEFAVKFHPGTILFFLNAHRHIDDATTAQAIWNLRDEYKTDKRMLVTLSPSMSLPSELKGDVVTIDEPLPNDEELKAIILQAHKDSGLKEPKGNALQKAIDAIAGLAAFPAETSAAMALTKDGIDLEILGEQRRNQVKGIPGASLWNGKETFKDIVGLANIKSFLNRLLNNDRERIRETIYLDEIDKMIDGTGDTSGVSQAMNEHFLSWTQDSRVLGLLLCGIPGCGKSATIKAASGEYDLPCLMASLSAVKGSLVGESEANIRTLFKTADAIAAGGRILMVATCNQLGALTPEIMARFRLGCFFYNFPTEEERDGLWTFYRKRFDVKDAEIPASINWVGREIESCCELSYLLDIPLKEAAKKIVPVCRAQTTKIAQLQKECSGRFVDASRDGIYEYNEDRKSVAPVSSQQGSRAIDLN